MNRLSPPNPNLLTVPVDRHDHDPVLDDGARVALGHVDDLGVRGAADPHALVVTANDYRPSRHPDPLLDAVATQTVGDRRERDPRNGGYADRHRERPHRGHSGRTASVSRVVFREALDLVLADAIDRDLSGRGRVPPSRCAVHRTRDPGDPGWTRSRGRCHILRPGGGRSIGGTRQRNGRLLVVDVDRLRVVDRHAGRVQPRDRQRHRPLPVVDRVEHLRNGRRAALMPSGLVASRI